MAATFVVATLEPFCISRHEEWVKWIRNFEQFKIASGLVSRDEEIQVNTIIYEMGGQAGDILHLFTVCEANQKKNALVKTIRQLFLL